MNGCACYAEIHEETTMIQFCPLHAEAERMRALLQQIADAPCDHGEQPFCPRNEAYRLLKTIKETP